MRWRGSVVAAHGSMLVAITAVERCSSPKILYPKSYVARRHDVPKYILIIFRCRKCEFPCDAQGAGGRVSLVESPLQVLDTSHETNLLARGKPEAGPEDPANEPVVAAILRNPNRKHNAASPGPDIAACSPDRAHVSLFHSYVSNFRQVFAENARARIFILFFIVWEDGGRRSSGGNFWKMKSVHVIDQKREVRDRGRKSEWRVAFGPAVSGG